MSDTTWDECKCCRHDTDCIEGLCIECFEYGNKPITEHPDVQRLIGQAVELQILVNDLTADKERLIGQVETLSQENKRLSKRDCNSTVQILLPTADSPFNKEDCRIVDVGYSDNIYVVECDAVVELQAANERLSQENKKLKMLLYASE